MTKTNYLLILLAWLFVPGCGQSTPEVESIVDMFTRGLQTNETNNKDLPDAEAFGDALISIALERFAETPDAAPAMFSAFEKYVSDAEMQERYTLWGNFLGSLDSALLHSKDTKQLRKNWNVRHKAIELQKTALRDWTQSIIKELDEYAIKLNERKDLESIQPFEKQNEVEALLELFADEEIEESDKLQDKVNEIAKIIDGTLAELVLRFEEEIETERQKDLPNSTAQFAPEKESETEGLTKWQAGPYQNLLMRLIPYVNLQDNPAISFWSNASRVDEVEKSSKQESFMERLVLAYQEAKRLQKIRYNLWSVRMLPKDSNNALSYIDPGLLDPSVGALYSQINSELMAVSKNGYEHIAIPERQNTIRKILLQNKVTLEAF